MTKFADPKGAYRLVNESCRLVEFDVKGRPSTTGMTAVLYYVISIVILLLLLLL